MRGFKTRFHLYTVPGQVFYDASRKLILKGVDGVIFVADSQDERMDANVEAIENLEINLKSQGYDLHDDPLRAAAQQARPARTWRRSTRWCGCCASKGEPVFEAVAAKGIGVFETLKGVAKLVLQELTQGLGAAGPGPASILAVCWCRRLPSAVTARSSVAQR